MVTKKDGDFLRVIASLAVIIVHSVHFWVEEYAKNQTFASLPYFATYLDQISRFTVPLFFHRQFLRFLYTANPTVWASDFKEMPVDLLYVAVIVVFFLQTVIYSWMSILLLVT